MFLNSFMTLVLAMLEIFILGAIGYILVKSNFLTQEGIALLSRLVIEISLPALIFCQLISDFNFNIYPNWWIFPLISVLITFCGLIIGAAFLGFIRGGEHKKQFLTLVTFQNSGYLPIGLVSSLSSLSNRNELLIYIFLFLLGFNLAMFSLGVYMLTFMRDKKFEWQSILSTPAVATLVTLLMVFLGLNKFIPQVALRPLRMIGGCTIPLALLVVGGGLALIKLRQVDKKAMFLMCLAKLVILPAVGLSITLIFKFPMLIGLLIVMQLAMPAATTLSAFIAHYKKEDLLVSQGIFFSHLVSIITIPIFLSLYFAFNVVK